MLILRLPWYEQPQAQVSLTTEFSPPFDFLLPSVLGGVLNSNVLVPSVRQTIGGWQALGRRDAQTYYTRNNATRGRTLLFVGLATATGRTANFWGGQGVALGLEISSGFYKHSVVSDSYVDGGIASSVPAGQVVSYCGSAGPLGSWAAFNGVVSSHPSFANNIDGNLMVFGDPSGALIAMAAWWDFQLPLAVCAGLSRNPWSLFGHRRIYIPAGVGGSQAFKPAWAIRSNAVIGAGAIA